MMMTKTIMVVDDSTSMRKIVTLALASAGHVVIEAADGVEALAKWKRMMRLARMRTRTTVRTRDGGRAGRVGMGIAICGWDARRSRHEKDAKDLTGQGGFRDVRPFAPSFWRRGSRPG